MPLRLATQNLDFATGAAKDKPNLTRLAHAADVLFLQEAKNLRLARLLPHGWHVAQSIATKARAGSALAWKVPPAGPRWVGIGLWLGVKHQHYQMLDRWMCRGKTRVDQTPTMMISVHIPPHRYNQLDPKYIKHLCWHLRQAEDNGVAWVVGTDANMPIETFAHKLGGQPHGKGIVGFVTSGLHVTDLTIDRRGEDEESTDHPAVLITVKGR